jgi:hypothetical protein
LSALYIRNDGRPTSPDLEGPARRSPRAPKLQGIGSIGSPGRWPCSGRDSRPTIAFAGRERSSDRPTQACGPCLLAVVIPRRTSFTVGPTTSVTTPDAVGGRSVQRRHGSGPGAPSHCPTPRSGWLHRTPLGQSSRRSRSNARRATTAWSPAGLTSARRALPRLACGDATPALYSRTVATKVLILWYTARGTFIWSKAAGCTMAPPERRLAAPWGPRLS